MQIYPTQGIARVTPTSGQKAARITREKPKIIIRETELHNIQI